MSLDQTTESGRKSISDLLIAAREGCQQSLDELLQNARPYLLAVANRRVSGNLRRKVAPSDLVQDTLLKATNRIHDFRGLSRSKFHKWLVQILLNHTTDVARAFHSVEKRSIDREGAMSDKSINHRADDKPSNHVDERDQIDFVISMVEKLPPDRQAVLAMRREELSYAEMGERLGVSPETARRLWIRAVEELGQLVLA